MGIGLTILFSVLLLVVVQTADAQTFSDLSTKATQKHNLQMEIDSLDVKILEQKITIDSLDKRVDTAREELRIIKSQAGQSWDALRGVEAAEKKYEDSQASLQNAKQKLVDILNTKSALVKQLQSIPDEIIEIKKEIKTEKFDPKSITKLIGIKLSNTCITLIKNHLPNNCPSPEILAQLDTSRQEISGKFIYQPYLHRGEPPLKNSVRGYQFDDTPRIIYDPPDDTQGVIKMITIENNFNVYFTSKDNYMNNSTRTWNENRFIDKCKDAHISTSNWKKTLPDTIYTMRIGCTITGLSELRSETIPLKEYDPMTSPNYLYRLWLKNATESCKGLCFEK